MDANSTKGTMPGELKLTTIIKNLQPVLMDDDYVFCSLPGKVYGDASDLEPLACVREPEGLTLVLTAETARKEKLVFHGKFRCIRLEVHSSLESVGLTAAVSNALAAQDISANLIAGTHHDHILVPAKKSSQAMEILIRLSQGSCL